jgi:SpoVK/Ycf46/Vps4 family AAA+-type ATPase
VDGSSMMSKWLGEAEKNVSRLFKMAHSYAEREGKPVILFIDELDSLLGERTNEIGGEVRSRNQFLTEMDGINGKGKDTKLYVIGATNKPWSLDHPFLRRFQKRIYVSLPSVEAREKLFSLYTNQLKLDNRVRLHTLASIFDGYSASDIKDICQAVQLKVVNEMFHSSQYKEPVDGETPSQPDDIGMKDFRETMTRRKPSVSMDMIRAYYKWSEQFKAL